MRTVLPAFALALLLPGCASHVAERDDATCQSYGAAPGTSAYYDCRQHIADQRQQMTMQVIQNMRFQPVYSPPPMPYLPPPQAPAMTNCTTNMIGNTAYTNCY